MQTSPSEYLFRFEAIVLNQSPWRVPSMVAWKKEEFDPYAERFRLKINNCSGYPDHPQFPGFTHIFLDLCLRDMSFPRISRLIPYDDFKEYPIRYSLSFAIHLQSVPLRWRMR